MSEVVRHGEGHAARATPVVAGVTWSAAVILHIAGMHGLDLAGTTIAEVMATGAVAGLTGWRRSGRKYDDTDEETGHVRARRYARQAAGVIGVTGGWLSAATWVGPLTGHYCPMTLLWGVSALLMWRWLHKHELLVEKREWLADRMEWLHMASQWGLGGSNLLYHGDTRLGEEWLVDSKGTNKRASELARGDALEELIAEQLHVSKERVSVDAPPPAGRVRIRVRWLDPWADAIPHPAITPCEDLPDWPGVNERSIMDPAIVGLDPDTGNPLTVPLYRVGGAKRIFILGAPEAGKTVLVNDLREWITGCKDALLVDINLSTKHSECDDWGPSSLLTALGPKASGRAMKILRQLEKLHEWREERPDEHSRTFVPSAENPAIVVLLDECDAAIRFYQIKEMLRTRLSKDREAGIVYVLAGQRATADWMGHADMRAMINVDIEGMVARSGESEHLTGDHYTSMFTQSMADYGHGASGVWKITPLGEPSRRGRTFKLDKPIDCRRLARARAYEQPDLPDDLLEYLGEPFAKLLAEDLYAQWHHGRQDPTAPPPPEPATTGDGDGEHDPSPGNVATLTREEPGVDFDALEQMLARDMPPDLAAELERGRAGAEQAARQAQETPDVTPEQEAAMTAAAPDAWAWELGNLSLPPDVQAFFEESLVNGMKSKDLREKFELSHYMTMLYLKKITDAGLAHTTGKGKATTYWRGPAPESGDGQ